MNITQELIERERTYRQHSSISNSDLGNFIKDGIEVFRSKYISYRNLDRIVKPKEGMLLGSVIHSLLVSKDYYNEQYLCSNNKIGGMLGAVVEELYSYKQEYSEENLKKAWLNSEFKAAKEEDEIKRDKAFETFKNSYNKDNCGEKYLKELVDRGTKTIIDKNTYDNSISEVGRVEQLEIYRNLQLTGSGITIEKEFPIYWECNGIKLKSLLDFVRFNFTIKEAVVCDWKTTAVSCKEFWRTKADEYNYKRQLAFYERAIYYYLNSIGEDIQAWDIKMYIVPIETLGSKAIFIPTSKEILDSQWTIIESTLEELKWYIDRETWVDRCIIENGGIYEFKETIY